MTEIAAMNLAGRPTIAVVRLARRGDVWHVTEALLHKSETEATVPLPDCPIVLDAVSFRQNVGHHAMQPPSAQLLAARGAKVIDIGALLPKNPRRADMHRQLDADTTAGRIVTPRELWQGFITSDLLLDALALAAWSVCPAAMERQSV